MLSELHGGLPYEKKTTAIFKVSSGNHTYLTKQVFMIFDVDLLNPASFGLQEAQAMSCDAWAHTKFHILFVSNLSRSGII